MQLIILVGIIRALTSILTSSVSRVSYNNKNIDLILCKIIFLNMINLNKY